MAVVISILLFLALFVYVLVLDRKRAAEINSLRTSLARLQTPQSEPQVTALPAAQPPAAKHSVEQSLGTNWLNRIGIILLVFGVALFLAYQLTHVGAFGKIFAGLAVAGALLGGGLWLERRPQYQVFARAFIGGGWALLFLTTYAAHYFDATRILDNEFIDLILLFLVGVGMVLHSLRYNSQVVTGLAFLLAFSTVTLSQITVYSLLASAVLALGLEIVCVREDWFLLELFGIVGAYGNHFLWLNRTLTSAGGPAHLFPEFWPSICVLLLLYFIFRIGYVLRANNDARPATLSGIAAVLNSVAVIALMRYQSVHPNWIFRVLLSFGVMELGFAFVVRQRGRSNTFAVLSSVSASLFMAAIPVRFHDSTWPLLWLIEAETLFVAGFLVREQILRSLGLTVMLSTLLRLLVVRAELIANEVPIDTELPFVCLAFALVLWFNASVIQRRLANTPRREPALLTVTSICASVAAAVALSLWFQGWAMLAAWSLAGILVFLAGLAATERNLRLAGVALLLLAVVRLTIFDVWQIEETARYLSLIGVGVALLAVSFLYSRYADRLKEYL
jgi:uncharacterized membrane protein